MTTNKFKLAVFDIDGTLTVRKDEIPISTLEAIKSLEERGIHCLIATGRSKKAVENIMDITGIKNYISLNGQYISYEEEVIYKYDYPKDVIERIMEISDEIGAHYVLTNDKGYYVPGLHEILKTKTSSVLVPGNIREEHGEEDPVNQIEVYCEDSDYHCFDELHDRYNFTRWHTGGFDIVVKGRSKSAGIKEVADRLGIQRSEIICFGDGDNDKDMVEYVGMGVAMGNATDNVKSVADYITGPVHEDGIYKACKKLGLF